MEEITFPVASEVNDGAPGSATLGANIAVLVAGIYIMQNTMVRGAGVEMISWGKKIEVREKNEKGERKKEGNYIKKGEKGLKNAPFWAINSKKFAGPGGLPPAHPLPSGSAPPAANLFVGKKK